MSRSKRSTRDNRPTDRASVPAKRSSVTRRLGFKGLMLTLLGIALGANIYYNYSAYVTSRADYLHAKEALSKDPREAERIAELAINGAGGRYPEAQLLLCRAYGLTGEWDAAFGCFSLIRDFRPCDPIELIELGNEAYQAGAWQLADDSLTASLSKPGPHPARARELLVGLDLRFHRTKEALNRCREWQTAEPDAALPWAISGDIKTGTPTWQKRSTTTGKHYNALRRRSFRRKRARPWRSFSFTRVIVLEPELNSTNF